MTLGTIIVRNCSACNKYIISARLVQEIPTVHVYGLTATEKGPIYPTGRGFYWSNAHTASKQNVAV